MKNERKQKSAIEMHSFFSFIHSLLFSYFPFFCLCFSFFFAFFATLAPLDIEEKDAASVDATMKTREEGRERERAREEKKKTIRKNTFFYHCLVHEKRRALDRRERVGEPPRLLVLGLVLRHDERRGASQGRRARVLGGGVKRKEKEE